jgi:hypothetical protein
MPTATTEPRAKDPHLPPMHRAGDIAVPTAPQDIAGARVPESAMSDLIVKLAYSVARFTTEWVAKELHLSIPLTSQLIERLCIDGLLETLVGNRYAITDRGREQAVRLLEVCGYVGPAPVRLEAYAAMLRWQFANTPPVTPEHVAAALSNLVVNPEAAKLAGLAVSSGRSLFIHGPPGNGKSSLGRAIHDALRGDYWIPYAVAVGSSVIRLFDEQTHERVDLAGQRLGEVDQRWVRIRRPFVVVGGELTLELLDLIYSPTLRYYEAAPHLKANGGVFLVDDFGRERVSPEQLLNRFITPMEHQVDYFTLETGQKIQVPLRHVLVIATNLSPELVTDPAFLRRIGYRLYLGHPSPEQYREIFMKYARRVGVEADPALVDRLIDRYREQNRELRSCEPRDLIERARDICSYESRPFELSQEVLDLAWTGYFGNR